MGDHRESPLRTFVGAGLRACPKILHFIRLWRIPFLHLLLTGLHYIYIDIKKLVFFIFKNRSHLFQGNHIESIDHSCYLFPILERTVKRRCLLIDWHRGGAAKTDFLMRVIPLTKLSNQAMCKAVFAPLVYKNSLALNKWMCEVWCGIKEWIELQVTRVASD